LVQLPSGNATSASSGGLRRVISAAAAAAAVRAAAAATYIATRHRIGRYLVCHYELVTLGEWHNFAS
jgi:hypothetical protein